MPINLGFAAITLSVLSLSAPPFSLPPFRRTSGRQLVSHRLDPTFHPIITIAFTPPL